MAGAGSILTRCPPESKFDVHCWRMAPTIEKISAITFRVLNMLFGVMFKRYMALLLGSTNNIWQDERSLATGQRRYRRS